MSVGNLFVFSAPSGAGKTTLCHELVRHDSHLHHLVSHTTRAPRPGEVDGRDYTFISQGEFRRMIDEELFAEWAVVHDNYYGTSMERIREVLRRGESVLMDIDVQGAGQIRKRELGGTFVFILPPSMKALSERLRNRRSDSEDVISRRLQKAAEEIQCYKKYDYLVVNDEFDKALEELRAIITAARLEVGRLDEKWIVKEFSLQPKSAICREEMC